MRSSVSPNWVGRGGQPAFRRTSPLMQFPHTDFGTFSRVPDGFLTFEELATDSNSRPDEKLLEKARIELSLRKGVTPLAALRLAKGLSQKEMARLLCTSQPRLSLWERGEEEPGFQSIKRLKAVLDVSYDELMKAIDA